jgi:3'-phosphoadenosine 5'-phosphosulfate sulfotransferase (PAPS reductase)/FAD synthetase
MLDKIKCIIMGHNYYAIQKFSKTERRVGCHNCTSEWGMNDRTSSLVDWDGELEEMYEDMGHEIKKPKF